jgi:hypothetical protein
MYDYSYYRYFHPTPGQWGAYGVFAILGIIGLWKIFEKAGKPGWAAIIPFYNIIVLLEVVGKPWWWLLLIFIPCLNVVFLLIGWVLINNLLSKSFGQGVGFTLGLMFLGFIFIPILGFGNYTYLGPGGAPITFGATDYEKPFDINS